MHSFATSMWKCGAQKRVCSEELEWGAASQPPGPSDSLRGTFGKLQYPVGDRDWVWPNAVKPVLGVLSPPATLSCTGCGAHSTCTCCPWGWPCFPYPSLAWTWQTVQHLLPNIEMNDYKKCYFWRHSSRLCIWQKVLGNRQCGMYWEGKKINLCICLLTSWRHIGTYFWHINEFCLI